jgi:hypothetical protein
MVAAQLFGELPSRGLLGSSVFSKPWVKPVTRERRKLSVADKAQK